MLYPLKQSMNGFLYKCAFQAAVKTALRVNDPYFTMNIYEEAGDVFFKGHQNRFSAIPFYRVGAYYPSILISINL